ncbi:MAG TPA: hypothetical protein VFX47_05580 [Gammaproteobacteria bacterium]|nr:hypothetical protein [Gammaproteobacteria bacterium]
MKPFLHDPAYGQRILWNSGIIPVAASKLESSMTYPERAGFINHWQIQGERINKSQISMLRAAACLLFIRRKPRSMLRCCGDFSSITIAVQC